MLANIIRDFASSINPEIHKESACAVCGLLTLKSQLRKLDEVQFDKSILIPEQQVTRKERKYITDPIQARYGRLNKQVNLFWRIYLASTC